MTATEILARQEPAETDLESWRVESHPVQIEYSRAVLQNIRRIFEDSSNRDVAGILFGTYGKDLVRVLGHRPVIRENAEALPVPLGERDNTTLLELLKAPLTDPQLRGFHPVGWYHGTAGAIQLAPGDLAVYNRYFPVRWQIALVLRVEGGKPTRAGFFVREKSGPMRSESSYLEFTVEASEGTTQAGVPVPPATQAGTPVPLPPQAVPPNGAASIRPVPAVEKASARPAAVATPAPKPAAAPGTIRPFVIPATATKEKPVAAQPAVQEQVKEEPAVTAPPVAEEEKPRPVATLPDEPKPANLIAPQPTVRPVQKRPTPEPKPGTPKPAPALSPEQGKPSAKKPAAAAVEEAAPAASGALWKLARARWLWISLAAVLVVGIVAVVAARRHAAPTLQTTVLQNGGLSLKAERDGEGLRVNWDRDAPPVQRARRAVLTIVDGARKEQINLGVNELQSGSVMYAPVSSDVNFQLSVYGPGNQGVSESVRIVSSRPSPLADLVSAKPAVTKPVLPPPPAGLAGVLENNPGAPVLVGSGVATPAPAPPPEPPAAKVIEQPRPPTAQAPDEPGRSAAAPTVAQNKPAQPSPSVQSKSVETPPPPVQKAPEPPKLQASAQQPASKPPAAAPQQQAVPKPPAPVVQQPAPTPAPPTQQAAGGNYVAPKPTRKVMPDVPANIRHLMVGSTVIDVKINVDANGQVTDAIPSSRTKGSKLGDYLGVRAAQAVRLWKFEPAKLDGKSVPAETVIQFKF